MIRLALEIAAAVFLILVPFIIREIWLYIRYGPEPPD
jgi:hypothetical protein